MSLGMKDLRAAAATGDANSQFNLGVVYENLLDDTGGHGAAEGNRAEAINWLLQAAQQGLSRAQIRLAETYASGPGEPGAHVRACTWFLVAATGLSGAHRHRAQTGFDRVARAMAPRQIAQAQRLARMWKPKLRVQPRENATP